MDNPSSQPLRQSEITRTQLGRKIVEIFAYGCMQQMIDKGIPLTADGFQQLVVHSQETGLKGRIAFQMFAWTQQRMQELFVGTGIPFRPFDDQRLESFRAKPSMRKRMLGLGLAPGDATLTDEEKMEKLTRLREYLGAESADVLEALRFGDCQRDLVWKRIEEIMAAGDHLVALENFKASNQVSGQWIEK
ncbi:hypothetical protein EXS65_01515 [Candidatus Peribacteria bacterium]|nr:hypothetical protein [Candidatus Peribacteria bacterium]